LSREITVRRLSTIEETKWLDEQFAQHYAWYKPGNYYAQCLEENREGGRVTLPDELEGIAARTSDTVGLGVGLYADYGNAQRLYGKRGYVMDGRGLMYANEAVRQGRTVTVDDDLLLYMVKQL